MVWKAGVSGNPGGRPGSFDEQAKLQRLARSHAPDASRSRRGWHSRAIQIRSGFLQFRSYRIADTEAASSVDIEVVVRQAIGDMTPNNWMPLSGNSRFSGCLQSWI
jgi:hypothetical protein